jgi:hypothetical protein
MLRWIESFPSGQLMSLHLNAKHSLMRKSEADAYARYRVERLAQVPDESLKGAASAFCLRLSGNGSTN